MGLAAVRPQPQTRRRAPDQLIYPYLLRSVTAQAPHHVWGSDITDIRLRHGWLYGVVVLDWYARYVVRWALDDTLELPFVLDAVDQALRVATPAIWNTDQGRQFTSPHTTARLQAAGARISMDGKGRAHDNIFTERFWRTLTYEEVYLHEYATPREARQGIAQYIRFYNTERPHQARAYQRPAEVYQRAVANSV